MSLELLKKNILQEKILVERLSKILQDSSELVKNNRDQKNFDDSVKSTMKQIEILNESIPEILKNISLAKPLPTSKMEIQNGPVLQISHIDEGDEREVGILKGQRGNYLNELHISAQSLNDLTKKRKVDKTDLINEYKKPRGYIKLSNKFFGNAASNVVEKGGFRKIGEDLRKSNFTLLTKSYVAAIYFSTFLAGFLGIGLTLLFLFVGITFESPYIYLVDFSEVSLLLRLLKVIWFIPLTPVIVFFIMYLYPSAEKSSLKGSLDYELPFAAIQMSAIAGADIEPSNIFRIIALNKEYPTIRNEAKKLMNQINLYGYDLTTALRNVAMASPSKNWSELLNGISTSLRSGGNLSKYLDKKAETLLFEYRLKKEKATKSAETFMDIYISVVIAAPMLMMMLLIMINISNIGFGLPVPILSLIIILIVAVINVIFLVFLNTSQKKM